MTLQEQLRQERLNKGWTQGELAERADIMRKHYQRIEVGRTSPTLATVAKIADALGVELTLKAKEDK